MRLSSVPGISGDEGWWGMQALAWLSGRPYEAHTTSGNPTDLFFLIPLALLHTIASPVVPAAARHCRRSSICWRFRSVSGSYDGCTAIPPRGSTPWPWRSCRRRSHTAASAQDPSQSVFWTGIVIYLCLLGLKERRRAWLYLGAALLVFPVALWTHPTNVFIAPFLRAALCRSGSAAAADIAADERSPS